MRFGSWKPWALAVLMAVLLPLPLRSNAATLGVLTIADGEVSVLRDTVRFTAAEGVRVQADDIVRTAEKARLVRIELDDGTVVDLGPATQALVRPRAAATADLAPVLYLLQGWAKVSAPTLPSVVWAPRIGAVRIDGQAMVHVGAGVAWVFAESKPAAVAWRRDAAGTPVQPLAEGDSFLAQGSEPGRTSRRLPATLMAQLPRALTDTLPRRAARFAAAPVAPSAVAAVAYADVAPWLHGEPVLRQAFVARYAALAAQPAFRSALVAEMALHPEWQRVVFPPPPARPRVVVAQRAAPVLPPPAARPASADTQWRVRIEPLPDESPVSDVPAVDARSEPTPANDPPAAESAPRGDTP